MTLGDFLKWLIENYGFWVFLLFLILVSSTK